jgi:hypothetical protein
MRLAAGRREPINKSKNLRVYSTQMGSEIAIPEISLSLFFCKVIFFFLFGL